jgi:hypothetical protein
LFAPLKISWLEKTANEQAGTICREANCAALPALVLVFAVILRLESVWYCSWRRLLPSSKNQSSFRAARIDSMTKRATSIVEPNPSATSVVITNKQE